MPHIQTYPAEATLILEAVVNYYFCNLASYTCQALRTSFSTQGCAQLWNPQTLRLCEQHRIERHWQWYHPGACKSGKC